MGNLDLMKWSHWVQLDDTSGGAPSHGQRRKAGANAHFSIEAFCSVT
jgi:hypothetical protein